jgi:hypothetical protein
MKAEWVLWGWVLLAGSSVHGQFSAALPVQSRSGQFLVWLAPNTGNSDPRQISPADARVRRLVPDLLAVSCEQIKHELFRELNIPEGGGNKVYVTIRRNAPRDQPIAVGATIYLDGWQYRLEFPEQVEGERVIRAIVQTLLLEVANRQARELAAEWPEEAQALEVANTGPWTNLSCRAPVARSSCKTSVPVMSPRKVLL